MEPSRSNKPPTQVPWKEHPKAPAMNPLLSWLIKQKQTSAICPPPYVPRPQANMPNTPPSPLVKTSQSPRYPPARSEDNTRIMDVTPNWGIPAVSLDFGDLLSEQGISDAAFHSLSFDDQEFLTHRRKGTPDFATTGTDDLSPSEGADISDSDVLTLPARSLPTPTRLHSSSSSSSSSSRQTSGSESDFSSGSASPRNVKTAGTWVPLRESWQASYHRRDIVSLHPIEEPSSRVGQLRGIAGFADKVRLERSRSFRKENLSSVSPAASPDPSPAGPVFEEASLRVSLYDHQLQFTTTDQSLLFNDEPLTRTADFGSLEREVLEDTQRLAASVARADKLQAELRMVEKAKAEESGTIASLGDDEPSAIRRKYEDQIERLRREAEEVRRQAELEMRKKQAEHEMTLKKLSEMQQLLEAREGGDKRELENELKREKLVVERVLENIAELTSADRTSEFLTQADHGVVALSLRIDYVTDLPSLSLDLATTTELILYAIVKLGDKELNCRLDEHPYPAHEWRAIIEETKLISWRDTFNFPYLNEKYISCALRLKENKNGDKQMDHLIGATRVELESLILSGASQTLKDLHLFQPSCATTGEEDAGSMCRLGITLTPSQDVVRFPYISLRPREMEPALAAALNQTLASSLLKSSRSADETSDLDQISCSASLLVSSLDGTGEASASEALESVGLTLKSVDFRNVELIQHKWRSFVVRVRSVRGLKLGVKTGTARLAITLEILNEYGCGYRYKTSIRKVTIQATRKKRLFALATYNEEVCIPLNPTARSLLLRLWNFNDPRASDDDSSAKHYRLVELGSCEIPLLSLLMDSTSPDREYRCQVTSRDGTHKMASILLELEFSANECGTAPEMGPAFESSEALILKANALSGAMKRFSRDVGEENKAKIAPCDALLKEEPTSCRVVVESCELNIQRENITPFVRIKLNSYEARTVTGLGAVSSWPPQTSTFSFCYNRNNWEMQFLTFECRDASDEYEKDNPLLGMCIIPLTGILQTRARQFSGSILLYNSDAMRTGTLRVHLALLA